MTEKRSCASCRHWDEGVCRRYPPSPVSAEIVTESSDLHGLIREDRVVNWWPDTADDEWCGEWSPT